MVVAKRLGGRIPGDLKGLAAEHPHLRDHLIRFAREYGSYPELVDEPRLEFRFEKQNIIYPTEGFLFAHAFAEFEEAKKYYAIEPELSSEERDIYDKIKKRIVLRSVDFPSIESEEEYENMLSEFLDEIVTISEEEEGGGFFQRIGGGSSEDFVVSRDTYEKIFYTLRKDIAGLGPLDPLLKDEMNEDVHIVSSRMVNVDHKVYGTMETDVDLGSEEDYRNWLDMITQRVGSPVSYRNPIVDATLPDGSRLNIVYSDDVSVEGPTLTIRKFPEKPFSIFRIVQLGTMSPELAAYLWLCIESNINIAVCGETAGGKTTTMNALTAFVPEDSKIYTAEDTLEIRPPTSNWQRLLTRERAGGGQNVEMFTLVKNALRSRPNYIVVGEVRGEEGFNVFQAMQTGHPTMFTFHAGNIAALVYRFTGDPINVPERFFGNLNVVVFQNFVKKGRIELRRVTSVREIEGYSAELEGIVTRQVFDRDPLRDRLRFIGRNNSFVLEEMVMGVLGYEDPKDVYDDLDERARVIQEAITQGITDYYDVADLVHTYQREGKEGLPFGV